MTAVAVLGLIVQSVRLGRGGLGTDRAAAWALAGDPQERLLLAAVTGDKITLTAGVTKDLADRVNAGDLLREFAERVGGKGGGKADMAQGGGTDVRALPDVLKTVPEWVASQLG